jgi:hypothetical protein
LRILFFLERGWRLYKVLRSVYEFAAVERPETVVEMFPEHIIQTIKTSRDRIQGNLNRVKAQQHDIRVSNVD